MDFRKPSTASRPLERLQHPSESLGQNAQPRGPLAEFSPLGTVWAGVQENEPLSCFSKGPRSVSIDTVQIPCRSPPPPKPANRLIGLGLRSSRPIAPHRDAGVAAQPEPLAGWGAVSRCPSRTRFEHRQTLHQLWEFTSPRANLFDTSRRADYSSAPTLFPGACYGLPPGRFPAACGRGISAGL